MAFYESIFITRQELGEKEIDKTIENFKGILEKIQKIKKIEKFIFLLLYRLSSLKHQKQRGTK